MARRKAPIGYVDCECCGIHVVGQWKCDPCESGACDPDVTWHCSGYGGHTCDGSGCPTDKGELAQWEADQAR